LINGQNSEIGFLINGETYCDLNQGLINYFFETHFDPPEKRHFLQFGYRINKNEDMMLENGFRILKETYMEVETVSSYQNNPKSLTADNINLDRIRFQVDGSTIVHLYALDYQKLKLVLDYFEENCVAYLTCILVRNTFNKTPLQITIEQDSPKNTSLMLEKLVSFGNDYSFSHLFFEYFPKLIEWDLIAFHKYLDNGFFQTAQMKQIKYLNMKGKKDINLLTHTSCIIDDAFKLKYCNLS
jgi:hypothetical protein